jgi:leader peptidase (prepilin peptidase)/N-methyltransferase
MIYAFLLVVGLCLGSFVNAWVWRLREQELLDEKTPKKGGSAQTRKDLSILNGRSMCVHCRHVLAWYDLLPVVSWLSLGGKCRYCQKPISWQYPLVELSTAALFVLSYVYFPIFHLPYANLLFALWLVFVVSFMALIVYDARWMELPDKIVFPLVGLAVLFVALRAVAADDPASVLFGAFGGLMAIGGLFWVLFQVSEGKWIGGGDVKLSFALGLLAGSPVMALLIVFVASILGTLSVTPQLIGNKIQAASKIPFGPFLMAATMIVVLWGQQLVDWYLDIIL